MTRRRRRLARLLRTIRRAAFLRSTNPARTGDTWNNAHGPAVSQPCTQGERSEVAKSLVVRSWAGLARAREAVNRVCRPGRFCDLTGWRPWAPELSPVRAVGDGVLTYSGSSASC